MTCCYSLDSVSSEQSDSERAALRRSAVRWGLAGSGGRRLAAEPCEQTGHLQQGVHTFSYPHVGVADLLKERNNETEVRWDEFAWKVIVKGTAETFRKRETARRLDSDGQK